MNIYEEDEDVLLEEESIEENSLVVFNDPVNTFQHVIECLMKICGHSIISAEQLSIIIHYKGKSKVKNGTKDFLLPMKEALTNEGLTVDIL